MLINVGRMTARSAGGAAPWAANAEALKAFLAANASAPNPHSQDAMASPPTVTWLADFGAGHPVTSPYDGLTQAFNYDGGGLASVSRFEGGWEKADGSRLHFPSATIAASGGNAGDGQWATCWRVTSVVDAAAVAFNLFGFSSQLYRFIVDGQYVSKTPTFTASGGTNYAVLDFGSKMSRTISVEGALGADEIVGVFVAPGDTVTAPSPFAFSGIIFGDSFTAATGATFQADGLGQVIADYLFTDLWSSGVGGTGYVATSGGSSYSLPQRLSTDLAHFVIQHGASPKIVVVAMGLNDIDQSGVQAAASGCFDTIRSTCADALVFVSGPWDDAAPSAPSSDYATCKSAIQAAIGTRGGFYFLDPEGVSFTRSDGTHPDDAGHTTLGLWLEGAIRTTVAAF